MPFLPAFAQVVEIPKPYLELINEITPKGTKIELNIFGETFRATIRKFTERGMFRIDISDDDFLSFYSELYEEFTKSKPVEVSISILLNGKPIPYNPFLQIWDRDYNLRLLKFSRLKPGCKPPVLKLKAEGLAGIKVWITFDEVKKLFEGGFKLPKYYCF